MSIIKKRENIIKYDSKINKLINTYNNHLKTFHLPRKIRYIIRYIGNFKSNSDNSEDIYNCISGVHHS